MAYWSCFSLFFLLLGGTQKTGPSRGVLGEIELRVQRYIMAKTIVSAATGGVVGGILAFLGVDLALVFGLFAFLLNFIPSLGSIIATLLPLPVVLVDPASTLTTVGLVVLLPGISQFLIGSLIEPKVVGGTLNLSPRNDFDCPHRMGHDLGHRRDVFSHSPHRGDANLF